MSPHFTEGVQKQDKTKNWEVLNQTLYSSHQGLCSQAKHEVTELIANPPSLQRPAMCMDLPALLYKAGEGLLHLYCPVLIKQ